MKSEGIAVRRIRAAWREITDSFLYRFRVALSIGSCIALLAFVSLPWWACLLVWNGAAVLLVLLRVIRILFTALVLGQEMEISDEAT
ncbi:hypothetical protein LX16_3259 [Stackebrandtia albiflava]|uniref:Uncharacterized protein n=1 Tax=Stackebrandtia albiflava TaxID=406432 RepID=A0A562V3N6_9ACTN|nr:hypothetical protein [Stackebrandtia albiflava]TWJ12501.1 hypothetical protein LX16_3259 [Stackebrandtia albiflava]